MIIYNRYTYEMKYRRGKRLIKERVVGIIFAEENQLEERSPSPILGKSIVSNYTSEHGRRHCGACFQKKNYTLNTCNQGKVSFCEKCIKNEDEDGYEKSGMDDFLQNLCTINPDSTINCPYDCNDEESFSGKKTATPAYLTVADLRNIGATEEQWTNYLAMSNHTLGYDSQCCLFCANAGHKSAKCPQKEESINKTAHLYAKHAGKGTSSEERPCPYCGIVTDKDEKCNSVTCDNCHKKWNFGSGIVENELHNFGKWRMYTLDDKIIPFIIPFNPNKKSLGDKG